MNFLLDTDTCSFYLKNAPSVMMHFGRLSVSAVTVGELMVWAKRVTARPWRLQGVQDFLSGCQILDIDRQVAETFGQIRADLLDRGRTVGELDLLNAYVALVHNLTVVTHNVSDYQGVPGLSIADWMIPKFFYNAPSYIDIRRCIACTLLEER